MAANADPPELVLTPHVSTPTHNLAEAVRAALEVDGAPGTPGAIGRLVGAALDDAAQPNAWSMLVGATDGGRLT